MHLGELMTVRPNFQSAQLCHRHSNYIMLQPYLWQVHHAMALQAERLRVLYYNGM